MFVYALLLLLSGQTLLFFIQGWLCNKKYNGNKNRKLNARQLVQDTSVTETTVPWGPSLPTKSFTPASELALGGYDTQPRELSPPSNTVPVKLSLQKKKTSTFKIIHFKGYSYCQSIRLHLLCKSCSL